jgi:hypothetical protein
MLSMHHLQVERLPEPHGSIVANPELTRALASDCAGERQSAGAVEDERMNRRHAQLHWALLALLAVAVQVGLAADAGVEQATIRLPRAKIPVTVDGTAAPGEYDDAIILGGAFNVIGKPSPLPNSPTVYVKRDAERLYITYDSPLGDGERPLIRAAIRDAVGVTADHCMELFIMPDHPKGALVWYLQVAGNARNAMYDTRITPQIGISDVAAFSPAWDFKNSIVPGKWVSELGQTFKTLGIERTGNGDRFDVDFCRDGSFGAGGASGYQCAFAGITEGRGVRVIFDDSAPAVQWLSFGEFEKHRFNPRLRLKSLGAAGAYTATVRVTGAQVDPNTKEFPELFAKTATVTLAAGESKEFTPDFDLTGTSGGFAVYRVVDAKNQTVFHRRLKFTTGNPRWSYPQTEPRPLVTTARMAPSFGRILATADILNFAGDKAAVRVEVAVHGADAAKPLATGSIGTFTYDYGEVILQATAGPLPAGAYRVAFKAMNKATGQPLGFEEEVTLERKVYDWENNRIGVTDKAFHPWPPLVVDGGTARAWGRDYRFTGLGLPASVPTLQPEPTRGPAVRDVLAAPVRLVAEVGGKPLAWREGAATVKRLSEVEVAVVGSAETDGLKAAVTGTLELDGFYKIRLKITPSGNPRLDAVRIEIPLPSAAALLFNHSAENMRNNKTFADFEGLPDGILWNSKDAARNVMVTGNFLPTVWIGDDDRGVAWMCDSERSWVLDFDKACLDVVKTGGETVFRMHLLNRPGELTRPIEVTFGFQPTPLRPRPAGGSWKKERDYGWSWFDRPLIYNGCFDTNRPGRVAEENAWYRDEQAKKDGKWWRYFCFNSDRIADSDPVYGQMVKDFGAEWYINAPLSFVQNKSHTDFILWAYKQWHDKLGLTGVYHDNTFVVSWPGLINDAGWVDEEGRLRAGHWVMAYREFMKRERAYWLSVTAPPVLKVHITDAPIAGYLGWADWWLDGENGGYPDFTKTTEPDFVDRWYNRKGMANLRITLGRQWGTMPQYLYTWGRDATDAVLGLFDLRYGTVMAVNRTKGKFDFGWDQADCEYIPYWDRRKLVQVTKGGPDVLHAIWKRPGRTRIMVSNLADDDRRVTVKVDMAGLGLPPSAIVTDEQTFEAVPFKNGIIRGLAVNRHNYRLLLIGPPDEFTPVDPSRGQALRPKTILFQDTFDTLRDDWRTIASPMAQSLAGPQKVNFTATAGHLRILSAPYTYGAVYRAVPEDNVSVQAKIRQAEFTGHPGYQPMLALYWGPNKIVRILTGEDNFKTTAQGSADGTHAFSLAGDVSGLITWVKITLRPDDIVFESSLDGFAWKRLHTQPRAGYEGKPAFVFLGRAKPGANQLLQNQEHEWREGIYSYYDDFVIGRE